MSFSYRILSGFKDDVYGSRRLSGRFDNRPKFGEVEVTSAPTIDLVDLAEVKNDARVRHSNDDALLDSYIAQAVEDVQLFTGRSIAEQTLTAYWKIAFDYVWLPRPPHSSITSVTEIDDDGTETTISSDNYDTFGRNELKIEFDTSIGNQLRVVYVAGYGNTQNDIPQWAKTAVHWQAKLYYDKNIELAIESESGLVMPAYLAAKNYIYHQPE